MVLRDNIEMIEYLRYEKLWTLKRIGKKFGVTRQAIDRILPPSRDVQIKRTRKVRRYIKSQADKTNKELAKELDCSIRTISDARANTRYRVETDNLLGIGVEIETYVSRILKNNDIENDLMPLKHPFDINASGCRIDVKSSSPGKLIPGSINPLYKFHVRSGHKRSDADFYICVTLDTKDIFVVPTSEVPKKYDQIQMTWPTARPEIGKYQKYHNRFDLIVDFIERLQS